MPLKTKNKLKIFSAGNPWVCEVHVLSTHLLAVSLSPHFLLLMGPGAAIDHILHLRHVTSPWDLFANSLLLEMAQPSTIGAVFSLF